MLRSASAWQTRVYMFKESLDHDFKQAQHDPIRKRTQPPLASVRTSCLVSAPFLLVVSRLGTPLFTGHCHCVSPNAHQPPLAHRPPPTVHPLLKVNHPRACCRAFGRAFRAPLAPLRTSRLLTLRVASQRSALCVRMRSGSHALGPGSALPASGPGPGLGSPLPTSGPGPGSPQPHLLRDWARPSRIFAGIAAMLPVESGTSARIGAAKAGATVPPPHLRRDWAHPSHSFIENGLAYSHICTGTGLPRPHLHRHWAHLVHFCTGTALILSTSTPGLRSCRYIVSSR